MPPPASGAAADPLFGDDAALAASGGFPDPLERVNRQVFRFNVNVDHWVFDPITHVYELVVPAPARRAVRRALANLNAPSVFVNDMLQLEPVDAGRTASRFALNSTVGVAGLFDVAAAVGIDPHEADFGQTLALYGVPSGPFLMLPLIGPTTVRDGTGYLVDFWFRPTTYFLTPLVQIVVTSIREGTEGFTAHAVHGRQLDALEAASIDFYAALKSAYYQDRVAQIWARRERERVAVR